MEVWYDVCALQNHVASNAHLLQNNSMSEIASIDRDSRESETSRHHPPRFVASH